jgi:hypothetical protein
MFGVILLLNNYVMNDYSDNSEINPTILLSTKKTMIKILGREVTDKEVDKVAQFMRSLSHIGIDQYLEESRREEKLHLFPGGYPFDKDGASCGICGLPAPINKSWYDKYGLKCEECQRAVNDGIIPGEITGHADLYYSDHDLNRYFNLDDKAVNRWIKKGLLCPKVITKMNGRGKHYRVFMLSEHTKLLPPKAMLSFGLPRNEIIGGKEYTTTAKWYQCCDPFEYLKDYTVMKYLAVADNSQGK